MSSTARNSVRGGLLEGVELVQLYPASTDPMSACEPAWRALRIASRVAGSLGAQLFVHGDPPRDGNAFYQLDETVLTQSALDDWIVGRGRTATSCRVALAASAPTTTKDRHAHPAHCSRVLLELEPWHTEETLFANSGIAHLLGDPEREPLVPAGSYAGHTLGYAVLAALIALCLKQRRFSQTDTAIVPGAGVLAWVNWKAAVAAAQGKEIGRRGQRAEWPVVECADGHVALVYTERDWQSLVEWVDHPALKREELATFRGRLDNREAYVGVLREFFRDKTKAELSTVFLDRAIPAAPVLTLSDLAGDPLLLHRGALEPASALPEDLTDAVVVPRVPHRIAREVPHSVHVADSSPAEEPGLPLRGIRVLDFGIITAGAGVSALLADLGAEVLKIESEARPDPFRGWAGAAEKDKAGDAPVFMSNNRNKLGLALDLKSESGKRTFFELVKSADVVLENFRRGVLDRLGLTFDALRAVNPTILLASISGQGLDGPGARHTTFGSTLEANSGFADLTRYESDAPVISGRNLNYPDQIVCLYGAAIVMAAVADCRERGIARHVDVSQRDCALFQLGDAIAHVSAGGADQPAAIRGLSRRSRLSRIVACYDGRYVALTAASEDVAKRIDGLESLDPASLERWASEQASETVVQCFLDAGGGATLSRVGSELLNDIALWSRQVFARSPNGSLVKGFPFQFSDSPMTVWGDSPAVGEHTRQLVETS